MCPRGTDRWGGKSLSRSVNGTGIVASPTDIQTPIIDQIQLTGNRRRIGRDILALRPVHPQLIMAVPDGTGKLPLDAIVLTPSVSQHLRRDLSI